MPNPYYNYLCIEYIISLVVFYGISTIVGYSMLNPLYIYICQIHDLQTYFVNKNFKCTCVHFFYSQSNGFKYFYLTPIILFPINDLLVHI